MGTIGDFRDLPQSAPRRLQSLPASCSLLDLQLAIPGPSPEGGSSSGFHSMGIGWLITASSTAPDSRATTRLSYPIPGNPRRLDAYRIGLRTGGSGGIVGQAVLPDVGSGGSDGVRQDCLTYPGRTVSPGFRADRLEAATLLAIRSLTALSSRPELIVTFRRPEARVGAGRSPEPPEGADGRSRRRQPPGTRRHARPPRLLRPAAARGGGEVR